VYDTVEGKSAMANETNLPETAKYDVNIEGTLYPWDKATITVAEIRQLGGLPQDLPVIEVDLQTNEERTLDPEIPVELRPGKGFGRKVSFKRG
jgi:hypothetical protein